MTTLNIVDFMLSVDECRAATDDWNTCRTNFTRLKDLIPTNYVFNISEGQLDWMREYKEYPEFCAAIGIHKGLLILILYPMNHEGKRIDQKEYPCSYLTELTSDLKLQEVLEYTVVKNTILSKGFEKIEKNTDMAFPVSNKPILEQDVAVEAIERWRESGMDWFYKEYKESEGTGIFKKFYVPTADLCLSDAGLSKITCSFGLKYNDIYGKMLVTLIFISFHENLQSDAERVQLITNTYDWAKPCPPICRIPDVGSEF
ncbi:hypothetical protein [Chryseobacterium sp. SIMBA_028]|uniref:hypothetical protein n=1 Tax=Chryseobacterium sp. SIMBA_028 TaxID=3085771 RepID=UPI00397971FD